MKFEFDNRSATSPFVDVYWQTESEGGGSFTSVAESRWGMVITKQLGSIYVTVLGPETKAMPAPVPVEADFFGIIFKLGTYMPHLPTPELVDGQINLPDASGQKFWLKGSAWEFPNFSNADVFVERLVREGLLAYEPLVDAVMEGRPTDYSLRSAQRRFLNATGLTHAAIRQIDRAKHAMSLLQQGTPILDTVFEAGYFDQAHLTRSLKHLMGQTPAQVARPNPPE